MHQVDLSAFIDILKIDQEKQTVTVEPLADMGQISHQLIPLGWTLAVLPGSLIYPLSLLISSFT